MSELIGSFISIDESNKNTSKSYVQQLVDIVQADIASTGSTTRKSYEVFVSGGLNLNSISSSLYQTVFDQDFSLGTSNPLFDISIGSYEEKVVSEIHPSNIIIEIHNDNKFSLEKFRKIFSDLYVLNKIFQKPRSIRQFKELEKFNDNNRSLIISEGRSYVQEWWHLSPK